MTKREKIFAVSGAIILTAAFGGRAALLHVTRVEWPESPSWFAGYADTPSKSPKVIIGHDSQYWTVKSAIRIDVRRGIPHTRDKDGAPIVDLVSYIDAEVARTGADYVVVSASREEKIGGVIAVIDECRKARVKAVIINEYLDAYAAK